MRYIQGRVVDPEQVFFMRSRTQLYSRVVSGSEFSLHFFTTIYFFIITISLFTFIIPWVFYSLNSTKLNKVFQKIYSDTFLGQGMVITVCGNSEIGAHVSFNLCYFTCLRLLISAIAVTNVFFFFKKPIFLLHACATCSELTSNISTMEQGELDRKRER